MRNHVIGNHVSRGLTVYFFLFQFMKVDQNHCVVQVHVRKYQTNKTVITLNYKQHAKGYYIDNGGEVRGGYLPKNMTMQIKNGKCIEGGWL